MYTHIETWQAETYVSTREAEWLAWITRAETLAGRSLDGDQDTDGYSLDDAYSAWSAGATAETYVRRITAEV